MSVKAGSVYLIQSSNSLASESSLCWNFKLAKLLQGPLPLSLSLFLSPPLLSLKEIPLRAPNMQKE